MLDNRETKYNNMEDKVNHWGLGYILKLFKEFVGKQINELTRERVLKP